MIKNILESLEIKEYGITNITNFIYLEKKLATKEQVFSSLSLKDRIFNNEILKNVRSIISIVFPYLNEKNSVPNPYNYIVSKYATRNDYHFVIRKKLDLVVNDLKKLFPNNFFNIYVDNNPLFEKEIAYNSGLGIYGKNSLLYNFEYGSYFFLGEILTDLFIPKTLNHKTNITLCNNCNLCINHCPNNALTENGLNPNKCISYLTSKKGDFNPKLIRNHLWGCDICQDICPMNKNKKKSDSSDFLEQNYYLDLKEILDLSNRKLKSFYKTSPIGWSGMNVLKRNANYILNNQK